MRLEVIQRGIEAYEKQVERDISGTCPLYRPKGYNKVQRKKRKARAKVSWYKPYDTVLFCPPTPKSELARKFKDIIEKQKAEGGVNIKVVEKAGIKLATLLPGLREEENCGRDNCFVHSTGGRGNCNRENIVYKGQCLTCNDKGRTSVYIGESGRSAYVRGKQHLDAVKDHRRNQSNAFARHIKEHHNNRETKFKMEVITGNRTSLERQVREGVEIMRANNADILMNSKLEYYQPGLRKLTFGDIYESQELRV